MCLNFLGLPEVSNNNSKTHHDIYILSLQVGPRGDPATADAPGAAAQRGGPWQFTGPGADPLWWKGGEKVVDDGWKRVDFYVELVEIDIFVWRGCLNSKILQLFETVSHYVQVLIVDPPLLIITATMNGSRILLFITCRY